MRGDIAFSRRDDSLRLRILKFFSMAFSLLVFLSIGTVYAYFSAINTKAGSIAFADVEIALTKNSLAYTDSILNSKITSVIPGDKININDITIGNTGSVDIYAIAHLVVEVDATESSIPTLTYDRWYNLKGAEINTNFDINDVGATYIAKNSTVVSDITFIVPESIGPDFKNADLTIDLTIHAIQGELRDSVAYLFEDEYASYMIYKESGNTPTGEPLRKVNSINDVRIKNYFNKSKYLNIADFANTASSGYFYAPIQLQPNRDYVVKIFRYNNFDGKNNGYLLLSASNDINSAWTAVAHLTSPSTSSTNLEFTTGNDGLLYIGYSSVNQSRLNTIWANTDIMIVDESSGIAGEYSSTSASSNASFYPYGTTTITRKTNKISYNGTESWSIESTNNFYTNSAVTNAMKNRKIYCSHFVSTATSLQTTENAYISSSGKLNIQYNDLPHTVADWQSYLSGFNSFGDPLTIWYELDTTKYTTTSSSNIRSTGTISYANTTVSKSVSDSSFMNTLTKTGDGVVTYHSSNTSVATVNLTTGQITLLGVRGTAIITAHVADSDSYTYPISSTSYTLQVNTSADT